MAGDAILYLLMYIDVSSFLIGTPLIVSCYYIISVYSRLHCRNIINSNIFSICFIFINTDILLSTCLTSNPIMPHVSYMIHKVPCYFCQQRSLFCAFYYPMFHIWYLDMLIILKSAFEIGLLSQNFSSKATR